MFDLPVSHLLATATIVLLAGAIRGYAGFGFSALVVSSLSLIMSPAQAVPLALVAEVAASIHLIPYVWREIKWKMLWSLTAGSMLATPLGIWLLTTLPVVTVRIVIAIIIIALCVLLMSRRHFPILRKLPFAIATGGVSGAFNGIGALGGMPIVVYCMLAEFSAAQIRATLAIFFLVTDLYAGGLAAGRGLYTDAVLSLCLVSALPLFAGVWLGNRRFASARPESHRRVAIVLLLGLSFAGLVRSGYELLFT